MRACHNNPHLKIAPTTFSAYFHGFLIAETVEPADGAGKIFCWSTLEQARLQVKKVRLKNFTSHRNSLKNQASATSTNPGFR
jgi:hypothetical protein